MHTFTNCHLQASRAPPPPASLLSLARVSAGVPLRTMSDSESESDYAEEMGGSAT